MATDFQRKIAVFRAIHARCGTASTMLDGAANQESLATNLGRISPEG
jgi:hypothetical protein